MKIIITFLLCSILHSVYSQTELITTRYFYSHQNIMPNDEDSIPYVFTKNNDTIIARIAFFHIAQKKRELRKLKKTENWGTYLFEGRELYDGRIMVHRLSNDYFL